MRTRGQLSVQVRSTSIKHITLMTSIFLSETKKKCSVFIFFYIQRFPETKLTMNADLWLARSTAFTLFQCSATDRRNTARVRDKARRPKTVGS